MFLDLIDVLRNPGQRVEKPLEIAPMTLGDIEVVEPVIGTIRVENARRNIVVGGRATTAISVPCSRCLQPSTQHMKLSFEAVAPLAFFRAAGFGAPQAQPVVPHAPISEEEEEAEPNDELVALFDGHSLDVLELVRQAIELQSPIAPLCSPDCAGLPDTQQYFEVPADDRWGALQNWASGQSGADDDSNNDANGNN
jgi:uncharacterized metal-binding protein YceD (DUF177 family)